MVQRASCHEHRSPAKTGKIMFDLIVDHGRGFGDHLQEQSAQLGNVPLTVAQLIEAASDRLVTLDLKRFKKGAARTLYAKTFIRSEERRVGKSVSVRVDLGGRRIMKKKKTKINRKEKKMR